jgi:hypothetical protein
MGAEIETKPRFAIGSQLHRNLYFNRDPNQIWLVCPRGWPWALNCASPPLSHHFQCPARSAWPAAPGRMMYDQNIAGLQETPRRLAQSHLCKNVICFVPENLLGSDSPTHALDPECWYAWGREPFHYGLFDYYGHTLLWTYQYPFSWWDFRNRRESRGRRINWFENSTRYCSRVITVDIAKVRVAVYPLRLVEAGRVEFRFGKQEIVLDRKPGLAVVSSSASLK